MRTLIALLCGAALASCTVGPPPPPEPPTPQAMAQYDRLIAGKVAQAPISCLPPYNSNDMRIIDGQTLAFRLTGGNRVYIAHLTPGCESITRGTYALYGRQFGSQGLCRGDIQQVIDPVNHYFAGSCTIGDIVPYVRPNG